MSTRSIVRPEPGLQIRLFGPLDLSLSGQTLPRFPTRRSKLLFAYLLVHRDRMHPRDVLAGALWGERQQAVARSGLRTALWRVRTTLGESSGPMQYVTACGDRVGFDTNVPYWLDVEEFEDRASAVPSSEPDVCPPDVAKRLREAVALYRGDLLEGEYDHWCIEEQDRLRGLFLNTLERLVVHHVSRQEWTAAAEYAKRLLVADPMREHAHRELMVLYYLQGDRGRAIRQFHECTRALDAELGVGPMRQTRALYDALLEEDEATLSVAIDRSRTGRGSLIPRARVARSARTA